MTKTPLAFSPSPEKARITIGGGLIHQGHHPGLNEWSSCNYCLSLFGQSYGDIPSEGSGLK